MGYGKWEATTYLGPRFAGQVIEKLKNCLTKVPFFYKRNFFFNCLSECCLVLWSSHAIKTFHKS